MYIKRGFKEERTGQINYNNYNSKMTLIDYKGARNILVRFENGYTTKSEYKEFKNGSISNPYDKSVFEIGYIGEGKYKVKINGKISKQYNNWHSMIERCYCIKYQNKYPAYAGCTVCEEWLNFQNFGKWHDENYYKLENRRIELDKDILSKGNKIYSPENCIYVPDDINKLFTKRNLHRGIYPVGVIRNITNKHKNIYTAQCSGGLRETHKWLGNFETVLMAFEAYKTYKEQSIKNIAEKYKGKIPEILYLAMYQYQVELTD